MISFGRCTDSFRTGHHFSRLECLELDFWGCAELGIPATFLRGPDQSDLRLRRLGLYPTSLASASISRSLSSATALTDLTLDFTSSQGQSRSLLAHLQHMQSLRSLDLTTPKDRRSQSQHSTYSTPEDIVPPLKLTRFHYNSSIIFLNNFMSGLSAPSLQDACYDQLHSRFPFLHLCDLSRVIDDVGEEFRSVSVTLGFGYFSLLSSTRTHPSFKSSFSLDVDFYRDSIDCTPSTKLTMVAELALLSLISYTPAGRFSLRGFLRQFPSVRVLRVDSFIREAFIQEVGLSLQQDDGEAILPVLEEIEVSILSHLTNISERECHRHLAEARAAFEPFVSARKRAGRIVKVTTVIRRQADTCQW